MSAKKDENKMMIPPDGGVWAFVMRNGKVYKGLLMARFDDGVIIEPEENVLQAFFTADIESMWQGPPEENAEPVKEA